ncbi:carboxyl-terminal processing protease CtpB [Umezakia ovalisporum]|jgi:carboxyl-terminal processing protease|uniref:Carboxyl-terminal-processing protease n=2 Tax=Umezakia ovalisporum TaxID=75695 RepID=A0AA43KDT3_9CYAN|nr:carboxyl-terminal processing protease CtpB [Umezakia ovalisporum]MBI1241973.1 PDZ domain-containing protein [Nostoc sp. RI_552]MDH6056781.1 S41 family peptidase [Umezakia ovalisporum FSS-43]MDH6062712.1 S41 family peptidase [Umezakia ovalisporum FSS-62]MDH6068155.1 S41 family peptidase [Umezakia ovalisporum APH033B]MDH6072196.1 S41 family peptidase [Umezakia ovalisporum CobakiLakeA]
MNQSAKRYSPLQALLIGGAIATTATVSVFGSAWTRCVLAALEDSPKALVDQVWQLVNREYVDGSFNQQDWLATRQTLLSKEYSSQEQAYVAIREALQKLGDPYTRFMDPQQYQALTSQTSGEVSGIGIRMEINDKTQRLTVLETIENSPALKAGIKPGDEILAIDGQSTHKMELERASDLIRGKVGTPITLQLGRIGQSPFNLDLTRATIEVPTVRYGLKKEGNRRVGYIRLREFSGHASEQMRRAIRDLNSQKVDAFVLDLRGNPGGLLNSSIEIARMWLDEGGIVRTVNRAGGSELTKANRTALTQHPLAILVDENSASASEILTGALKDNKRAVVIGSQTFGKAMVQSVHQLADGSGLAVTIAHYYTPDGTDINKKGIVPDIKLDLTAAQQRQLASNPNLLGTQNDPQYTRAIAALSSQNFAQPPATHSNQPVSSGARNLKF